MSQPPKPRQRQQTSPTRQQTSQQRRDAVAQSLKALQAKDAATTLPAATQETDEQGAEQNERTLMRRRISEPASRPVSPSVARSVSPSAARSVSPSAARSGARPAARSGSRAIPRPAARERSVGSIIKAIPPWLSRHRRSLLVGGGGLVAGVILACLFLALLAPQPEAVTQTHTSGTPDGSATLDDAFLSDLLADALTQAHLPIAVDNVQAHVKAGNEIDLSGNLAGVPTLPGQSPRLMTATLQLSIVNGALHAHIATLDFGGLTIPGLVTGVMEAEINTHLSLPALTKVGNHHYAVTSLTTKDGSITLTLQRD